MAIVELKAFSELALYQGSSAVGRVIKTRQLPIASEPAFAVAAAHAHPHLLTCWPSTTQSHPRRHRSAATSLFLLRAASSYPRFLFTIRPGIADTTPRMGKRRRCARASDQCPQAARLAGGTAGPPPAAGYEHRARLAAGRPAMAWQALDAGAGDLAPYALSLGHRRQPDSQPTGYRRPARLGAACHPLRVALLLRLSVGVRLAGR
jgi:hypothetical protein